MVESFGIRDCGASFCTPRVLYGCAKTPGHLQRPVKSGISAPPKTAKVEKGPRKNKFVFYGAEILAAGEA